MTISINDDFDLYKIVNSGQVFRAKLINDEQNLYRFISQDKILYIKNLRDNLYDISCDESEWNDFWIDYFDLKRNYMAIRKKINKKDFLNKAADYGKGIRILKQDKWEMLISYIISQRKSIPAIRTSLERICELYGREVNTQYEKVYLFPSAIDIFEKGYDYLSKCGLGYRLPYITNACEEVLNKIICLDDYDDFSNQDLISELKKIKGVGDKVANCIGLFAYSRMRLAPVDVWIARIIDNEYNGINPFDEYGDASGIVQQYGFYYIQNNHSKV